MSNTPTVAHLEAEYKLFKDAIERHFPISPPAQKPASVPGGSGAGLVGNPLPTVFPNLWSHLRHPSGRWFTVCGNRCVTLMMTRRHFSNTAQRAA